MVRDRYKIVSSGLSPCYPHLPSQPLVSLLIVVLDPCSVPFILPNTFTNVPRHEQTN
jgi:hypothetical protein